MANEFKIKNGLVVSGDAAISGAATVNGNSVIHTGNIGSYAVTSLTDTLATVTGRGATTTNAITVGGLNLGANVGVTSLNAYGLNYILFNALTANTGISAGFTPNGTPTGFAYNFQFGKSSTANNNSLLIIGGGSTAGNNSANKHIISTSSDGTATGQPLVLRVAPTSTAWGAVNDHFTIFPTGNVVIQSASSSATDAGYKLDVDGTSIFRDSMLFSLSGNRGLLTWGGGYFQVRSQADQGLILGLALSEGIRIPTTGNVLIGTTIDGGYKLDVNGTGRFTNELTVGGVSLNLSAQGTGLISSGNSVGGATTYITMRGPVYYNPTSGVAGTFAVTGQSYMSSGTAQFNTLTVGPTINNSGTYSGIFRGFYYNPTLTSLTGTTHRAIETVTGDVIFGSTSGNVGIGITSPTAKLQVVGSGLTSATTSLLIQDNLSRQILKVSDDWTTTFGGSSGFIVDPSNKRILIGQSGSFYNYLQSSSAGVLQFFNDNTATENFRVTNARQIFTQEVTNGFNLISTLKITGNLYPVSTSQSAIDFNTYTTSGSGTTATRIQLFNGDNGNIVMQPTGTGNVGIGTTSPVYKLDIVGETRIGTTSKVILGNDGTYSGYSGIGFGGTTNGYNRIFAYDGTSNGLFLCSATGRDINFRPNGGTVDVFTVAANNSLYCNSYLFASEDVNYNRFYRPNGTVGIYLGASDAGNYYDNTTHYFRNSGGNTNYVTITSPGNVLVGTTIDSGYKLDVNGTARVLGTHRVWRDNQIGDIDLNLYNGQAGWQGGMYYHTESGGANQRLTFYSGGAIGTADALTINASSRNVGIGTTTPAAKLHVSGSVTASTALAQGVFFNNTLVAAANNDVLVGLDINPTFTNGAFTNVVNLALRTTGNVQVRGNTTQYGLVFQVLDTAGSNNFYVRDVGDALLKGTLWLGAQNGNNWISSGNLGIYSNTGTVGQVFFNIRHNNGNAALQVQSNSNILLNSVAGNVLVGTTTDAGYKLDVSGTGRFTGALTASSLIKSGGTSWQYLKGDGSVTTVDASSDFVRFGEYINQPTFANKTVTLNPSVIKTLLWGGNNIRYTVTDVYTGTYPAAGSTWVKTYELIDGTNSVYSTGNIYLGFWVNRPPANVTVRVQNTSGTWYGPYSGTEIRAGGSCVDCFAYWKIPCGGPNYIKKWEITLTPQDGYTINLQTVDIVIDNSEGIDQGPFVSRNGSSIYGTLSFIGSGPTTNAYITNGGVIGGLVLKVANNTGILEFQSSGGTKAGSMFMDGSIWRLKSSNSTDTLNIFANGNLGIKQTTDAGYTFDVNGTARFSGNTYLAGDILVSNGSGTRYIQASNGSIGFLSSNSSGYNLWTNNSNVGIKSELYINSDLNYNTGIRLRIGSTQTSPSGYSYELSFNPQVGHVPTHTAIRTLDSTYGGNSTVPSPLYIFGGQNTTTGTYAHVILQSDFTTKRGNVGIGLTNPQGATHIAVASGTPALILSDVGAPDTIPTFQFRRGPLSAFSLQVDFPSNNKARFQIGDAVTGYEFTGGNLGLTGGRSIEFAGITGQTATAIVGSVHTDNNNGQLLFSTRGSGVTAERARITNNGNFLINTSTDAGYKLDVNGIFRLGPAGGQLYSTAGNTLWANFGNVQLGVGSSGGESIDLSANSTGEIRFGTASVQRMVIKNSGNVGIGTTSPASKLQVNVGTDQNVAINSTGGVARISAYDDAVANSVPLIINGSDLRFTNNVSEAVRITGGNVGIGTTTPSEKLEVNGSIRLSDGNADGPQLKLASAGYSDWNIDNYNGSLRAYYGSTEYTRLTSSGNFGIGTDQPVGQLNVFGGTGNNPAILTLQSQSGGGGNTGIYFRPYQNITFANTAPAQATILAVDASYSAHITFSTKVPGSGTNSLVERMRLTSTGSLVIGSTSSTGEALQVTGSIKSTALSTNGPVVSNGGVLTSVNGYTGMVTIQQPVPMPPITFDIQNGIIVNVM